VYKVDMQLLASAGVRCYYLGSNFVGALAYADDVVISASTAADMRGLLSISDEYARQYNISFNANKSKYMVIEPNSRQWLYIYCPVSECACCIGNKLLERVDSFVHLGYVLSSTLNDDED
jgi:Reverse transcriptase (RNA-dependent DNA polymerase)